MSEDRRAWDLTGGKDDTEVHPNVQVLLSDSELFFRYYLEDCKALVFVVDSSDRSRMPEAQKALKKILVEEKLTNVPLMVLANKKDLPNSMTIREVSLMVLNLKPVSLCRWGENSWMSLSWSDFEWAGSAHLHWSIVGDPGLQRSEGPGSSAGLQFHQQNDEKKLRAPGAPGPRRRSGSGAESGGLLDTRTSLEKVLYPKFPSAHPWLLSVFGYNKPF